MKNLFFAFFLSALVFANENQTFVDCSTPRQSNETTAQPQSGLNSPTRTPQRSPAQERRTYTEAPVPPPFPIIPIETEIYRHVLNIHDLLNNPRLSLDQESLTNPHIISIFNSVNALVRHRDDNLGPAFELIFSINPSASEGTVREALNQIATQRNLVMRNIATVSFLNTLFPEPHSTAHRHVNNPNFGILIYRENFILGSITDDLQQLANQRSVDWNFLISITTRAAMRFEYVSDPLERSLLQQINEATSGTQRNLHMIEWLRMRNVPDRIISGVRDELMMRNLLNELPTLPSRRHVTYGVSSGACARRP